MQAVFGSSFGLNIFERTQEVSTYTIQSFRRVEGTLGHPNTLAQYLSMSFFLVLASIFLEKNSAIKWLYFFVIGLSLTLLILTFSRSGWVAFLLSYFIFCVLQRGRVKSKAETFKTKYYAIGIFVIFLITGFVFKNAIVERFAEGPESSTLVRILLLKTAYNMVVAHPFVGVGINNFTEVMREYDTTGVSNDDLQPVHNIYAIFLSETGIVGLVFFLLMVGSILLQLYKQTKSLDPWLSRFSKATLAGLMSVLMSGMLTWGLRGDSLPLMFWLFSGLGYGMSNIPVNERLPGAQKKTGL